MWRRALLALFLLGALVLPVLPVAADDDGDDGEQGKEAKRQRDRDRDRDHGEDDEADDEADGEGDEDGDDGEGKQRKEKKHKERNDEDGKRPDRGFDASDGRAARAGRDAGPSWGSGPPRHAPPVIPDDFVGPILPGILPDADLRVEQDYELAGGMLAFTFLVANAGIEVASDVALHDELPELPAGDWAVADPRCSLDGDTLTCALGDLPPGALASVTVAAPVSDEAPDLANTVQATARRV